MLVKRFTLPSPYSRPRYGRKRAATSLLLDADRVVKMPWRRSTAEKDRTLRAVLVGMLREAES
jgi:hypothetical protein